MFICSCWQFYIIVLWHSEFKFVATKGKSLILNSINLIILYCWPLGASLKDIDDGLRIRATHISETTLECEQNSPQLLFSRAFNHLVFISYKLKYFPTPFFIFYVFSTCLLQTFDKQKKCFFVVGIYENMNISVSQCACCFSPTWHQYEWRSYMTLFDFRMQKTDSYSSYAGNSQTVVNIFILQTRNSC